MKIRKMGRNTSILTTKQTILFGKVCGVQTVEAKMRQVDDRLLTLFVGLISIGEDEKMATRGHSRTPRRTSTQDK